MLIEFRVENHRSLRDPQALTMEIGRATAETDNRPRTVLGHEKKLLTVAAIYGANAGGKSNIVKAFALVRDAVINSQRIWPPVGYMPRDPFAWGPKNDEPSTYITVFVLEGTRYEYGFSVSAESFVEEWLFAWPHGKKQTWFTRDAEEYKFGDHLLGENKQIREFTRPNSLFLSAAAQFKHVQLTPIFSWFRSMQILDDARDSSGWEFTRQLPFTEGFSDNPLPDNFRSLLKNADIGISDCKIVNRENDGSRRRTKSPQILLKHETGRLDSWLPIEEESRGTQTLFKMGLLLPRVVQEGGILIVDELESSLHPVIARAIVKQFNDPETNPNNAQLIFTTHDTNLLGTGPGEPVLRRDQVWLTEKNKEGATELYPLTDFHPRNTENLENGYLQGRYGAVPFLNGFTITGE